MKRTILSIVLWISIGLINLITGDISKLDYWCCYSMVMILLAEEYLNHLNK